MSTHFDLHDPLDDVVRSLDPADASLDDDARRRAEALLDRIISTPSGAEDGRTGGVRQRSASGGRRRRLRARWLIPAAAAAAVVTVIAVNGGGQTPAYASWTPKPGRVASPVLAKTADACRASMADWEKQGPQTGPDRQVVRADTAKVVVAEQRGDYVFVSMVSDSGAEIACLAKAGRPDQIMSAGGSSPSATTPAPAPVAADNVEQRGVGLSSADEGTFGMTSGRVGRDVRGVTIVTGGTEVEATVANGWFSAWWPAASGFVGSAGVPDVTYRLTLADGSRRDASPDPGQKKPGPAEIGRVSRGGGTDGLETVDGEVGARVRTVVVHADGRDVTATLSGGTFHAEWPMPTRASGEVKPLTYTLTLDDGTVLKNVKPVSGSGS